MSQSPHLPSSVDTPPPYSMADPSIVHSMATGGQQAEDYHPYYPSSAFLPPSHVGGSDQGLGSGLAAAPEIVPKRQVDMNFAQKGEQASLPGIDTPLAVYAAQMVVWLWFGKVRPSFHFSSPGPIGSGRPSDTFDINHDAFEYPRHPSNPLHPLQVAPSPDFTHCVNRLLRITGVSHSVVLVALLYIYRLKRKYSIDAGPGTEMRPFIASIILSNKYLDDNTYTNHTWAELTGLTVAEIGRMEIEFLRGLEYKLCVHKSDYDTWRQLLDGFIASRQHQGIFRSRFDPVINHSAPPYHSLTPSSAEVPSTPYVPSPAEPRARSVSPTTYNHDDQGQYVTPGYGYTRKRSAVDAHDGEEDPAEAYESQRRPTRRTNAYNPNLPMPQSLNSGLNRSSSLSRQGHRLAPMLGQHGRRGSTSGDFNTAVWMNDADLRHQAQTHAAQMSSAGFLPAIGQQTEHARWDSLVAPYDQDLQIQSIPPQHLIYYSIAADPHPGQDGRPRKAILRQQQPYPCTYTTNGQPYTMTQPDPVQPRLVWRGRHETAAASPTAILGPTLFNPASTYYPTGQPYGSYPVPTPFPAMQPYAYHPGQAVEPLPGQFANAGPPGYTYNPNMYPAPPPLEYQPVPSQVREYAIPSYNPASNPNRWSTVSEETAYQHMHGIGGSIHAAQSGEPWRTRSEWSSPLPRYEGWRG